MSANASRELARLGPYHPRLRLNAVSPWFTMFPLSFPLGVVGRLKRTGRVLDPFCGRGTTLYAARLLGHAAVGLDVHPVAAATARAKLATTTPQAIVAVAEELLATRSDLVPEGEFWDLAYSRQTLRSLCRLRAGLRRQVVGDDTTDVLRAITLGILHGPLRRGAPTYASNQMPRTYATKPAAAVRFWRARGLTTPPKTDILDLIGRRAAYILSDLPKPTPGQVICEDSRRALQGVDGAFDAIVTSPPYLGLRTYRPDQWLREWFLGGKPYPAYDYGDQLTHRSDEAFVAELGAIWRTAAVRCRKNAKLAVRFGALGSRKRDPERLLRASIEQSDCGWVIETISDAGVAPSSRRQASQFTEAESIPEIDCEARLRT